MSYYAFTPIEEEINLSRSGSTASVTIICPYSEAIAFAETQVGGVRSIFGIPTFFIGAPYGRIEGLYCNDAKIKPLGNVDSDLNDWKEAKVILSFGPLDQQQEDNNNEATEIGDISYSVSGEELVLPRGELKSESSGGEALDDNIPNPIKIVPKADLTISFKNKPKLDPTVWEDYVGKTNAGTFKGWGAEKVLFLGAETKRTVSSDGTSIWEHQFKFEVKPTGWNKYWKPSTATWTDIFPKQYVTDDLNEVFG